MFAFVETGQFSDFRIIAGGDVRPQKNFAVHRLVLSARSEFFRALMSFGEGCNSWSTEVCPECVECLLRYLYDLVVVLPPAMTAEKYLELWQLADFCLVFDLKSALESSVGKLSGIEQGRLLDFVLESEMANAECLHNELVRSCPPEVMVQSGSEKVLLNPQVIAKCKLLPLEAYEQGLTDRVLNEHAESRPLCELLEFQEELSKRQKRREFARHLEAMVEHRRTAIDGILAEVAKRSAELETPTYDLRLSAHFRGRMPFQVASVLLHRHTTLVVSYRPQSTSFMQAVAAYARSRDLSCITGPYGDHECAIRSARTNYRDASYIAGDPACLEIFHYWYHTDLRELAHALSNCM
ncbi:MAG: BTB/POZ domain-containing protein [Sulfobacillus sp.]